MSGKKVLIPGIWKKHSCSQANPNLITHTPPPPPLFAAGDTARNVHSGEERGETDVFAG